MKVFRVLRNEYKDSLYLMRLSSDVSNWNGIQQAVIVMGTESNKRILKQVGLDSEEVHDASHDDLIIAVELDEKIDTAAFTAQLERRLKQTDYMDNQELVYPDLDTAFRAYPDTALVSVSTPGEFATNQAREALLAGKHVFCFSHHIPIETEIELKDLAIKKNLLMMGPDCGTAILDGIGLGFANQVRPGTIGIISASGSGLQEVISLIHRAGGGISQAIGIGGRDLISPVDGRMALSALQLITSRLGTDVVIILAKKISPEAHAKILAAAAQTCLPIIVQFHNSSSSPRYGKDNQPIWSADTYEECAKLGIMLAGIPWLKPNEEQTGTDWIKSSLVDLPIGRKYIRGLFSGGSLCGEAYKTLTERGISVQTNLAGPVETWECTHRMVDLGAEEYTEGRVHPFIDHRLRAIEIDTAFADSTVAVLLVDVVLGWGCHEDPAGEMIKAIKDAQARHGRGPVVIASVCGTNEDPQNFELQRKRLQESGVYVAFSNATAARLAWEFIFYLSLRERALSRVNLEEREPILSKPHVITNIGLSNFEAGPRNGGAKILSISWHHGAQASDKVKKLLDELN